MVLIINIPARVGATPLHIAVMRGHAKIVKLLLKGGAQINARDNDNATPLHFASMMGYADIVKLLLENGADVNASEIKGWTPLHFAVDREDVKVIKLLLEKGAIINALDDSGYTPIHYAIFDSKTEIINLLLKKDGNCVTEESKKIKQLDRAHYMGPECLKRLLLEKGINVNNTDDEISRSCVSPIEKNSHSEEQKFH